MTEQGKHIGQGEPSTQSPDRFCMAGAEGTEWAWVVSDTLRDTAGSIHGTAR